VKTAEAPRKEGLFGGVCRRWKICGLEDVAGMERPLESRRVRVRRGRLGKRGRESVIRPSGFQLNGKIGTVK